MRTTRWAWVVLISLLCAGETGARPLTLRECVDLAMERNVELKALEERQRQAGASVRRAVAGFLPKVSLSSVYSQAEGGRKFDFPVPSGVDLQTGEILYDVLKVGFLEEKSHDTKFEVVQPLFQGGALLSQLGQARAQRRAVDYEYGAKREEIAFRVKEAFYNILRSERLLEVSRMAVDQVREHLRVARSFYDTGLSPRSEVLRAEVQLSSTEQDNLRAFNALSLSRDTFDYLLDWEMGADVDLVEPEVAHFDLTLEECLQEALIRNQGLLALQAQTEGVGKTVGLARSAFLPKLSLVYDYGWHEERYDFSQDADYWMIMGMVSMDLFAGGGNVAAYQEAKAEHGQMRRHLMSFRQELRLQVRAAYLELEEARNRLDLAEKALASAEENYRSVNRQYQEGLATQADEIDAEVTLTQARMNQATTYYDILVAQSRLEMLMARGIEDGE